MPQPRTRFAAAVFNNQIWVIGGYDNVAGSGAHRDAALSVQTTWGGSPASHQVVGPSIPSVLSACAVRVWHVALAYSAEAEAALSLAPFQIFG